MRLTKSKLKQLIKEELKEAHDSITKHPLGPSTGPEGERQWKALHSAGKPLYVAIYMSDDRISTKIHNDLAYLKSRMDGAEGGSELVSIFPLSADLMSNT